MVVAENNREVFEIILPDEERATRCMPNDAGFEQALRTRNCYALKCGSCLLITLENS